MNVEQQRQLNFLRDILDSKEKNVTTPPYPDKL